MGRKRRLSKKEILKREEAIEAVSDFSWKLVLAMVIIMAAVIVALTVISAVRDMECTDAQGYTDTMSTDSPIADTESEGG